MVSCSGVIEMAMIATATEMQNNFGRYVNAVMKGDTVVVTRNGKEVGRFLPKGATESFLTDSLIGVLSGSYDLEQEKDARLRSKYACFD